MINVTLTNIPSKPGSVNTPWGSLACLGFNPRIENIPELMTVERPVELSDPWQEMYELEAMEYHELDSSPINPTLIDTSYSATQNPYLNGLGQTDAP
ncbi:hypothetical protein BOTCAL_0136g00270 [Botryotinia calthae]|uniref:Uncharacterized protein n=1 Tax=Botryotinia calthae TaxID=38488 RepID=A0A4Y8D5T1_9HELO|nr:hypothetical protein BOTCAL_0136g00270 [Botryotinia calthae]